MDNEGKAMIRMALTEDLSVYLRQLLLDGTLKENGAICLISEGRGQRGTRLLVTCALKVPADAWEHQGDAMLRPSARFISSAVSQANTSGAGLMFVHSHPDPRFPIGFSQVDLSSFRTLAETLSPMLDGSFAAAVVHPHGWAGVLWQGKSSGTN